VNAKQTISHFPIVHVIEIINFTLEWLTITLNVTIILTE